MQVGITLVCNKCPTPSKLKLCSRSVVLEVLIAFYHVDFYFLFLIKSQLYCNVFMFVSIIRFFHFSF